MGALTRPLRPMAEPTLADVFGSGASQNANVLTIQKSDLAGVGLTASASNRAEALLVAIILRASQSLSETARTVDLVNRNVSVSYVGQDLVSQAGQSYRRDAWTVLGYKSTALIVVDPDDY